MPRPGCLGVLAHLECVGPLFDSSPTIFVNVRDLTLIGTSSGNKYYILSAECYDFGNLIGGEREVYLQSISLKDAMNC